MQFQSLIRGQVAPACQLQGRGIAIEPDHPSATGEERTAVAARAERAVQDERARSWGDRIRNLFNQNGYVRSRCCCGNVVVRFGS